MGSVVDNAMNDAMSAASCFKGAIWKISGFKRSIMNKNYGQKVKKQFGHHVRHYISCSRDIY